MNKGIAGVMALVSLTLVGNALADELVIPGLTFSVAADGDYPRCCRVTVGPVATLGVYTPDDYGIHGLSEFDLSGVKAGSYSHAELSFVYKSFNVNLAGVPVRTVPTFENILVTLYQGDNRASISDYFPIPRTRLDTFGKFPVGMYAVGDRISFDISSMFLTSIANNSPALGVRLALDAQRNTFAEYSNFTLSVSNIPEPSTYALMVGGLGLVWAGRRYRRVSTHAEN